MTSHARSGADGRLDQRLFLLRLLDRLKDRQAGPARRLVLRVVGTWFGRSPERFNLTTSCRQCGRWESVTVFRLGRHRARYWCQHCGAVVALAEPGQLWPVGEQPATASPGAAPGTGPAAPPDAPQPQEMLPRAMLHWAGTRSRQPITVERLDKGLIYQLYRQWDAQLEQAGPTELAELNAAGGDAAPLVAGLPAFPAVIKALHDHCYRTELVVAGLLAEVPATADRTVAGRALWQRVEHARRWLAVRGGALCWIHAALPDGTLVTPDPDPVATAIDPLRAGDDPGPDLARTVRAALFGTDRGPSLRRLRQVFPADQLATALGAYVDSGARPLREDVLAQLSAPLAPPRPGGW